MKYLFSLFIGTVFGSFANVCILRLPENKSVCYPGSSCPRCGHVVASRDNIPILSYLLLKGRCRHCRAPISLQYPIVEAFLAVLFLIQAWVFRDRVETLIVVDTLSFFLFTISVIDYRHRIIPDELSLSLMAIGLCGSFANPLLAGAPFFRFIQSLIWGFGGGLFMLAVAWIGEKTFGKEALGGGDVKLIAATGAVMGLKGILGPLLLGSMLGGLTAIVLLLAKKKKFGETLPFGPFLSLGAYLTCLFPHWMLILSGPF